MVAPGEKVRVDQWLTAARIFKSRTSAQEACERGHVLVEGQPVRSSRAVMVGDKIEALAPRGRTIVRVLELANKRASPALARTYYEDMSPPPPPKDPIVAARERGAGRPTKQDRRKIERFRGGF